MNPRRYLPLLFAAAVFSPLAAQEHPQGARGFVPDKVYSVGEVDAVNTFNGNLVVTISVSPEIPIREGWSYGVKLTHHGSPWDFQLFSGTDSLGRISWKSNAGVGWRVSFGELLANTDPRNQFDGHVFIDADGAEHRFHRMLHETDPEDAGDGAKYANQKVLYTRDGSYLRLRLGPITVGDATIQGWIVEHPDGMMHLFNSLFELIGIEDRFQNRLAISQQASVWTLTDPHGRTQRLHFVLKTFDQGSRRVLDRVEIQGPNNALSTWSLEYEQRSIPRACPDCPANSNNSTMTPHTFSVPFLSRVRQPDGSTWEMPFVTSYQSTSDGFTPDGVGVLKQLKLPSQARFEWDYGLYRYPEPSDRAPHRRNARGVIARRKIRSDNTVEGLWTYTPELTVENAPGNVQPQNAELIVRERTPLGDLTEHFYSVYALDLQAISVPGADAIDFGLPFTPKVVDSSNRKLSRRIYDCELNGTTCVPVREIYVRYEREPGDPFDSNLGVEERGQQTNPRVIEERTVFLDDREANGTPREVITTNSRFDGLGQYRNTRVEPVGAIFGAERTESVEYNPGRGDLTIQPDGSIGGGYQPLSAGSTWILNNASQRTRKEGTITAVTEICFEPATGWVARTRTHSQSGAPQSGNDTLHLMYRDNAGQLIRDEWYGGDVSQILLGNSCGFTAEQLGMAPFAQRHLYTAGVRSMSEWMETDTAAFVWKTLDRSIEPRTGLVLSERDLSLIQTEFEYDAMFRRIWSKPEDTHGGWTEIVYTPGSPLNLPIVEIKERGNGSKAAPILRESRVLFDSFGRVWRRQRKIANGSAWTTQETTYDGMSHVASVSEVEGGTPSNRMQYLNYDPFGRAKTIRPADGQGHDVDLGYAGIRKVTREVKIWGDCDPLTPGAQLGECESETVELSDPFGRMFQITEPAAPGDGTMTTSYSYDVNDRLIQVLTSGAGAQTRSFSYDLRGFLRSEAHPEKGLGGNGSVFYSNYDALGNARKKVDGAHDLRYTFDRANRLTQVTELPSGASAVRKLQEWIYGTVNEGGNRKLGKVIEQTRWNFIQLSTVPQTPYTGRIKEFFTYAGRDGRISSSRLEGRAFVTGTIPEPVGPTEKFESSWIYDPLGNVTSIDYPRCLDNNPEPDSCPNPTEVARLVTPTYEQGLLKTVPGYASGITYHPNLLVQDITHTNGIKVTQGNDPKSMHRPSVITAAKGLLTLWTTGAFTYDGAGNLKTIGSWAFEYDKVSRLTKAAFNLAPVGAAVSPKTQSFTYDAFGNLQEIAGDAGRVTTTHSGTNRLATAGSQYDASGNLTNWSTTAIYGWDALDKMWRMKNGSEEWYYFYNADGERVWSYRFGGTHSRWTPRDPGGMVLREFEVLNGTWQISNDYIYRGSQLLASETLSGTRHFHSDHLGTPRLITDSAGNQVAYHVYYPYGEEATAFNQDGQRMKFTGHERDLASAAGQGDDLDYMHARFCSPITGRFLGVDPVVLVKRTLRNPRLWNRYSYALSNPLANVDPSGAVVNLASMTDENRKQLLNQLSATTGLVLGYKADSGTLVVLGKVTSASGEQVGSSTARSDLTSAIDSTTTYYGISRNDSDTVNMGQRIGPHLSLDFTDIAKIDTGKNDAATFNAGIIFLHELKHAQGLKDPVKGMLRLMPRLTGETVDHMNRIRRELGLPIRSQYRTEQESPGVHFIPFSNGPVYVPGDVK